MNPLTTRSQSSNTCSMNQNEQPTIMDGKFHGTMPATRPNGCRMLILRYSDVFSAVCPSASSRSPEKQFVIFLASSISPAAEESGLPIHTESSQNEINQCSPLTSKCKIQNNRKSYFLNQCRVLMHQISKLSKNSSPYICWCSSPCRLGHFRCHDSLLDINLQSCGDIGNELVCSGVLESQ